MTTARRRFNVVGQEVFLFRCAEHEVAATIYAVQISIKFGVADKIVAP